MTLKILSFRFTKSTNIFQAYGYTYDLGGTLTGFDNNGSNSSDSLINKKFQNDYGYVWNVIDKTATMTGGQVIPLTKYIETSVYFTPDYSDPLQYFFTDYEHNYKTYSFTTSASISGVGLTGTSLTINYYVVNSHYQRTSSGIMLGESQ